MRSQVLQQKNTTLNLFDLFRIIAERQGVLCVQASDQADDRAVVFSDDPFPHIQVCAVSVGEYLKIEKNIDRGIPFRALKCVIEKKCDRSLLNSTDYDSVFLTFTALHECGHFETFRSQNTKFKKLKETYESERESIKSCCKGKYQQSIRYHEIELESLADDYAAENLAQCLPLVKALIG
jgi:hypothetical protein